MSVVPGLPPPPTTHPASPERNRQMSRSPVSGYGSPVGVGYVPSGSPGGVGYVTSGSPIGSGYEGSPSRIVAEERMREEARHREIAAHISRGIGCGSGSPAGSPIASPAMAGIAGYRSPRQYQPVNVGVPPSHPVYDTPVHQVSGSPGASAAAYHSVQGQYGVAGSPTHHVPSPGTPTQPVVSGEGESPRRIRAWGASGTLH